MRVVPSIFFLCLQSPTNSFISSIKKATYTMMWNVYHLLQLQLNGLLLGNRSISFSIAMLYVKQWLGHAAPLQKKWWKLKFILQYAEFTYSKYLVHTSESIMVTMCTLCSTKIKRSDISYVPLRQSREVQLPS